MTDNTIVKATIEYSDGSSATFTGEPLDLSTIPTQSPDQQADTEAQAEQPAEEEAVPEHAEKGDEIPDRNKV